jgi:hypothetical protein
MDMRITYEVGSYNARRYSRPWIAKVERWDIGKSPILTFGGHVGVYIAEIDAEPGNLLRYGQRDGRGNNTARLWGVVQLDGSLLELNAEEARQHWLDGCPAPSAGEVAP